MSGVDDRQDATTPKKGGFGAFSQQYRDRWAANHPNTKPTRGGDASTSTSTVPADAVDAARDSGATP